MRRIAAVHEFESVQVFGRGHDGAMDTLRRPASEKRQAKD